MIEQVTHKHTSTGLHHHTASFTGQLFHVRVLPFFSLTCASLFLLHFFSQQFSHLDPFFLLPSMFDLDVLFWKFENLLEISEISKVLILFQLLLFFYVILPLWLNQDKILLIFLKKNEVRERIMRAKCDSRSHTHVWFWVFSLFFLFLALLVLWFRERKRERRKKCMSKRKRKRETSWLWKNSFNFLFLSCSVAALILLLF